MTGFARTSGHRPPWAWAWEIKAVNAKGLDVRLRLPPGFDRIEAVARDDRATMTAATRELGAQITELGRMTERICARVQCDGGGGRR